MEIDKKSKIIKLNGREFAELKDYSEFRLVRLAKGVFAIIASEDKESSSSRKEIERKLRKASLQQRVEGRFEKMLSNRELELFKEMLKEGEIIKFKLSEKYKKAIYKLRSEYEAEKRKRDSSKGASIEKNGYVVLSDEEKAKEFSTNYAEQIKRGEIIGVKGFDGNYYFIKKFLLTKLQRKIFAALNEVEELEIGKLCEAIAASEAMTRAACEILKERGELIEKRKNLFALV